MKKSLVVIVGLGLVIIIGVGAYWLGAKRGPSLVLENDNKNQSSQTANVSAPLVTFEKRKTGRFQFEVVKEWTIVAPEEIQKSITEEQRHGYSIEFFQTNPDAVTYALSSKTANDIALQSMAQIVHDDRELSQRVQSALRFDSEEVADSDALTEATLASGQSNYKIFSRYILLPTTGTSRSWVLAEVSVPTSKASAYREIVDRLLSSLKLPGEL